MGDVARRPTAVQADRREYLRRRFLSLGIGELVAAVSFGVAGMYVSDRVASGTQDEQALWLSLSPLLFVLVQGGIYWLAARTWVKRRPMPAPIASIYRALRLLNPVLIGAVCVGVVLLRPSGSTLLVGLSALGFAAIEYLNYFVVRLSYPLSRWAREVGQRRIPRLRQDLRG